MGLRQTFKAFKLDSPQKGHFLQVKRGGRGGGNYGNAQKGRDLKGVALIWPLSVSVFPCCLVKHALYKVCCRSTYYSILLMRRYIDD